MELLVSRPGFCELFLWLRLTTSLISCNESHVLFTFSSVHYLLIALLNYLKVSFFCWGRKGRNWRPRGNSTAKLSSLGFLQSPPGLLEDLNPPLYRCPTATGTCLSWQEWVPWAQGHGGIILQRKSSVFGIRLTGVSVLARPGMCHDPWADLLPSLIYSFFSCII